MTVETVIQRSSQVKAVTAAAAVFVFVFLAFKAVRLSPLGLWEMDGIGWPLLSYISMGAALLTVLRYRAKLLGVDVPINQNYRSLAGIAAACVLPVGLVAVTLNFVDWRAWPGALLVTGLEIAVLCLLGWLLRSENPAHSDGAGWVLLGFLLVSGVFLARFSGLSKMAQSFLFYFLVVAPNEEMAFRGVIQTRLNAAFGCPFRFFGTAWGWGLPIAALFFSLWHVLSPINPLASQYGLALPWGLWTFAAGLIFGLVREKTGGLIVPVFLHGVLNFL
jgi:uncharacterized protein